MEKDDKMTESKEEFDNNDKKELPREAGPSLACASGEEWLKSLNFLKRQMMPLT